MSARVATCRYRELAGLATDKPLPLQPLSRGTESNPLLGFSKRGAQDSLCLWGKSGLIYSSRACSVLMNERWPVVVTSLIVSWELKVEVCVSAAWQFQTARALKWRWAKIPARWWKYQMLWWACGMQMADCRSWLGPSMCRSTRPASTGWQCLGSWLSLR